MKTAIVLSTIILACFLLYSCNSNSSKATPGNQTNNASSTSSISTGDEGSYSFTVAGKR